MDAQLSVLERRQLKQLEKQIEEGVLQAGAALLEIRDQGLYRESHTSFEGYLKDRWNLAKSTAYRLISSSDPKAVDTVDGEVVSKTKSKKAKPKPKDAEKKDEPVDDGKFRMPDTSLVELLRVNLAKLIKQIDECPSNGAFSLIHSRRKRICMDLGNAKRAIDYSLPHSLCPQCLGKQNMECQLCQGRMWVDKLNYESWQKQQS